MKLQFILLSVLFSVPLLASDKKVQQLSKKPKKPEMARHVGKGFTARLLEDDEGPNDDSSSSDEEAGDAEVAALRKQVMRSRAERDALKAERDAIVAGQQAHAKPQLMPTSIVTRSTNDEYLAGILAESNAARVAIAGPKKPMTEDEEIAAAIRAVEEYENRSSHDIPTSGSGLVVSLKRSDIIQASKPVSFSAAPVGIGALPRSDMLQPVKQPSRKKTDVEQLFIITDCFKQLENPDTTRSEKTTALAEIKSFLDDKSFTKEQRGSVVSDLLKTANVKGFPKELKGIISAVLQAKIDDLVDSRYYSAIMQFITDNSPSDSAQEVLQVRPIVENQLPENINKLFAVLAGKDDKQKEVAFIELSGYLEDGADLPIPILNAIASKLLNLGKVAGLQPRISKFLHDHTKMHEGELGCLVLSTYYDQIKAFMTAHPRADAQTSKPASAKIVIDDSVDLVEFQITDEATLRQRAEDDRMMRRMVHEDRPAPVIKSSTPNVMQSKPQGEQASLPTTAEMLKSLNSEDETEMRLAFATLINRLVNSKFTCDDAALIAQGLISAVSKKMPGDLVGMKSYFGQMIEAGQVPEDAVVYSILLEFCFS